MSPEYVCIQNMLAVFHIKADIDYAQLHCS